MLGQLIMKTKTLFLAILILAASISAAAQSSVDIRNVRAHMEFLASDAMQGRGSGTQFEQLAGLYLASQMKQIGIEPAGDVRKDGSKGYVQTIDISRSTFETNPSLSYEVEGSEKKYDHGKDIVVFRMYKESVAGTLTRLKKGEKPKKGSISLVTNENSDMSKSLLQRIGPLMDSGAAAILVEEDKQVRAGWVPFSRRPISFSSFAGASQSRTTAVIFVSHAVAKELATLDDGAKIGIGGKLKPREVRNTWNTLGMIKGRDPKLQSEVILLSAHMDHVGVRPSAPGDDKIFNGADDDASGCIAVLELARVLARGKRPKRTVYFAFYGSEEAGGFGSRYFAANMPFPKEKLIANLQIEMIGRPDPKVGKDELWLTGFDRSNLGSELSKHGGKIVNDPHPQENFFRRSDNYTLARQGIIAHTVSSFGLHKDYHRASDEIETIDFGHLTRSINSLVKPVKWLLNSNFKPEWYPGKKP